MKDLVLILLSFWYWMEKKNEREWKKEGIKFRERRREGREFWREIMAN